MPLFSNTSFIPSNNKFSSIILSSPQLEILNDFCKLLKNKTPNLKTENNVIVDCKFDGVACTICTSSTDIMCELVKGKTINEAKKIIDEYFKMIYEKPFDEEILEEAVVFKNTYKQAARIKCATLGWNGLNTLLEEELNEKK